MPSRIKEWPAWPEFSPEPNSSKTDADFVAAKRAVVSEYGPEKITKSWIEVCEALKSITDEIAAQGNKVIPVVQASRVLASGFSADEIERVKSTGCLIIRGVIPQDETKELYKQLRGYIADNKPLIGGWPADNITIFSLYNSPVQNTIRTHPDHLRVQKTLNTLWHDDSGASSPDPMIYLDAVRDRPPRQAFLGLGPHIDAGSLCRWAEPVYRTVYDKIFSGRPAEYDAWDLTVRKDADQDFFKGSAHSRVFRAFQGWTALTRAAPNEGSLLLYPHVAMTIAYMLLRPFFRPPENTGDVMDARKWTFDAESGWFPGTMKSDSQRLSRTSHPHLRLEQCLVHVPTMEPGDTVWWHSDVS